MKFQALTTCYWGSMITKFIPPLVCWRWCWLWSRLSFRIWCWHWSSFSPSYRYFAALGSRCHLNRRRWKSDLCCRIHLREAVHKRRFKPRRRRKLEKLIGLDDVHRHEQWRWKPGPYKLTPKISLPSDFTAKLLCLPSSIESVRTKRTALVDFGAAEIYSSHRYPAAKGFRKCDVHRRFLADAWREP